MLVLQLILQFSFKLVMCLKTVYSLTINTQWCGIFKGQLKTQSPLVMNPLFSLVNHIKVVCSGSCGWLQELVTENHLSSFHLKVRGSSGVQSCTLSTLVAIIHPLLFQTVAGVFGLKSKVQPQLKGFILDKLPVSEQALSCFEYVCT